MKKKFLILMSSVLVICASMFIMAGCDNGKKGELTVTSNTTQFSIDATMDEALSGFTFTYVPYEGETYSVYNEETQKYEKVGMEPSQFANMSYSQARKEGLTVSGFSTKTATKSDEKRVLVFSLFSATFEVEYTVA